MTAELDALAGGPLRLAAWHHVGGSASPARAITTMVHNESVFLPIWSRHYSQFFAPEDMYVLDKDTDDGSTACGGFVLVPMHHESIDWGWHRDQLQRMQHELLTRYDVVRCCDVDEIVVPDPATGTLGRYIDAFTEQFVNCRGFEVLHRRDHEPPLELGQPVLAQRDHWFANPAYSKPLLARVPMYWHGGLHSRVDGATNGDGRLVLIHLRRMDYDLCLGRHRQRVDRPWNRRDLEEAWGYRNRIVAEDRFSAWFSTDSCCAGVSIEVEPIPETFRQLV